MKTLARTEQVLNDAIDARVFPGGIVEVGSSTAPTAFVARGSLTYENDDAVSEGTIYDLASLTKVVCTAALTLGLVEKAAVGLDDPVQAWCPSWTGDDRKSVTLRHLLEHASGLPAHRRYFERLEGRDAFERAIATEPLEFAPGTRSVYSDLGFMLLGFILERAGGTSLDRQFERWRVASIGDAPALRFLPPPEWLPRIAPTEYDPGRRRLLRGEVHDENAQALGGVAAHAGLFGTAAAVGACARWWMQHAARSPMAAAFLSKGNTPASSRALGWDTMLRTSSCGTHMTASAVGHTGFTGTSLWIDPGADRYVVCLTNRVHPGRAGDAMARVRPAIHDAVAEDLVRSS